MFLSHAATPACPAVATPPMQHFTQPEPLSRCHRTTSPLQGTLSSFASCNPPLVHAAAIQRVMLTQLGKTAQLQQLQAAASSLVILVPYNTRWLRGCHLKESPTTSPPGATLSNIMRWADPCIQWITLRAQHLLRSPNCSSSKQSVALCTCSSTAPSTNTPPAFSLSAKSPCSGFSRS